MTSANDNSRQTRCQRLDRLAAVMDNVILRREDAALLEREYKILLQEKAA